MAGISWPNYRAILLSSKHSISTDSVLFPLCDHSLYKVKWPEMVLDCFELFWMVVEYKSIPILYRKKCLNSYWPKYWKSIICVETFYQIGVWYERGSLNFFQYDQNHQSWHPATHNKCFRNWIFPSSRGRLRLALYEFIMQIFYTKWQFSFLC